MNTNKKDVNDYFKYLKLYYRELAKKKKKELDEKKKKQEEILVMRKKQQEEFDIVKKQLQDNIDNINKQKIVSKTDLNKDEIKQNTKVNNLENIININLNQNIENKNNIDIKKEQIKQEEKSKQKNTIINQTKEFEKLKENLIKQYKNNKQETKDKEQLIINKISKSSLNKENQDKLKKEILDKLNVEKKKQDAINNDKKIEDKKKHEENIIGKDEFIKTINKRIKDDYESLRELDLEIHRINSLLNNTKDVNDIKKLLERLKNNQKNIDNIIERINMIKDGTILKVAYDLSKTKPNELKEFIKEWEKEPNNAKYLRELYPEFKYKLDYTDTVYNIKEKTEDKKRDLENKIDEYTKLNENQKNNDKNISAFKTKLNSFKDKLLRFQMSVSTLENDVKNIVPVLRTETKYYLGNMEIKNELQLKQIAMKLSQSPNNTLSLEQIYNELKNKIKTVTKETIEPSNNFKINLLEQKNKLISTKKDINLTIEEVRDFKREFQSEYNDYLSSSEFYEYYSEIESIEDKLVNQKNKTDLLNIKMDKSILENDKKIAEINKMNIKMQKQKQFEKLQRQQQNPNQHQNPNQQQNINQQYYNQNYVTGFNTNTMDYINTMMFEEEELEQTRGRLR